MRTLSAAVLAILSGASIPVRVIARLHLPSGLWGASDSEEDFIWQGLTYKGFGQALQFEIAGSTTATRPQASTMHLSAVDPSVLTTFFQEVYRAQPCDISTLIFDPATNQPVEEVPYMSGSLDVPKIEYAPAKADEPGKMTVATLTCTVAPLSSDMTRKGVRTRSDADQRLHRDANDGFFKDVGVAGKTQINWGRNGPTQPNWAVSNGVTTPTPSPAAAAGGLLSSFRGVSI